MAEGSGFKNKNYLLLCQDFFLSVLLGVDTSRDPSRCPPRASDFSRLQMSRQRGCRDSDQCPRE